MNNPEKLALQIAKEMKTPLNVTDSILFSGDTNLYIENAVDKFVTMCKKYDITTGRPESVFTIDEAAHRKKMEVDVYLNNQMYSSFKKETITKDNITFRLEKTSIAPYFCNVKELTFYLAPSGFIRNNSKQEVDFDYTLRQMQCIAFDRPVSRKEYETRWMLQVLDGLEPVAASAIARKI